VKPPPFGNFAPTDLTPAIGLLNSSESARLLAGGRSLVAMLNMRYVFPDRIVETAEVLRPLQRVSAKHHNLRCGSITPGTLLSLVESLRGVPGPMEDEIREAISGNLCHCTAYHNIIKATLCAAAELRANGKG
jgi:aerobic-type carbon monoxide dehydrogenase small subunit (CoxS/CutS family)